MGFLSPAGPLPVLGWWCRGRPYCAWPPSGVTLKQFEDEIIKEALRRADGNRSQAVLLLGLSRNALRYRLSKMGVPDEEV